MVWDGIERRKIMKIKRFLYIDDSEDILKIVEDVCETKFIHCTTTKKATKFLYEFETGMYDVALVDYKMNFIDGVTLIRLIDRKKSPHTKIYIMTAYDVESIKRKINSDRIDGVISKEDGVANILNNILSEIQHEPV